MLAAQLARIADFVGKLRIVSSDWHVLDGSAQEPCDRPLIDRLVDRVLALKARELLLLGDIGDLTRGGSVDEIAWFIGQRVGRPMSAARIPVHYVLGNHDYVDGRTRLLAEALYKQWPNYAAGMLTVSTGPEYRGRWHLEHGNRFDPWCRTPGGVLTDVGEVMTRLDFVLDHVGVNIDDITSWEPNDGEVASLDFPMHRRANRWAAATGSYLVTGHSHFAYEAGGVEAGQPWRALNCGALTKGHRLEFAWITDEGDGGVVREEAA